MREPNDPSSADTIARVIHRLRSEDGRGPAADAEANRVLARVEPVARRTCLGCARGLGGPQVEDLVQETLFVVWRRLPDFEAALGGVDNRPALERWTKQIARFICANAQRKRRDTLTEDGLIDIADPQTGALAWLAREERNELLRTTIEAALSGDEQDVLYHRHVHELERAEIARLLGLADADQVRVKLQAAQRKLKPALTRKLEEIGRGMSMWHEDFRG